MLIPPFLPILLLEISRKILLLYYKCSKIKQTWENVFYLKSSETDITSVGEKALMCDVSARRGGAHLKF